MVSLEDEFCDIIKKARFGQGQSLSAIAQRAKISEDELQSLEKGSRPPNHTEVQGLGQALGLRSQPLTDIAINEWGPKTSPPWLEQETVVITILGDIGGYAVKGYIVFDEQSKEAVMIDTGYNAKEMLSTLEQRRLKLTGICLTHGHTDHAGGLDRILQAWSVPVYLGEGDFDLLPWKPSNDRVTIPKDHQSITVGNSALECLATPGHTPGGICYRMCQIDRNFCFVGDTLFAGSVGRSNPFSLYSTHLSSVQEIVLQLPEDTVLLPGHGPATTVREERAHNPFA